MRSRARVPFVLALLLAACDGAPPDEVDAGGGDAGPPGPYSGEHQFPAVTLEPGAELLGVCQSWTLNNETDLWVNAIVMDAGPGWHHSNWTFLPDTAFDGPDGTWNCRSRGYHEVAAAAQGGGVFFAQSTQNTHEEQRMPEGTAFRIPAHSRVIGSIHVLNTSPEPLDTAIGFTVETLDEAEVQTELTPLVMDDRVIEVPARGEGEATMDCDFESGFGEPLDFSVYYVLAHYHASGTGLQVHVVGGPNDGELIYETSGGIGDSLGGALSPPYAITGATGLRLTCTYENLGDEVIEWGENAADEMCTVLMYTDLGRPAGSLATIPGERVVDGRVVRSTAQCEVVVDPRML